ncbi:hypothetical protein N7532_000920 [Penicillium argentinense]|uniref:Uncharacterized protein n=1 Tax=Penicillium argentinense TaxID=1131581 RepID=A0A9W9KL73_9EURO|nr:uncharacterized protein N7532_000920 [Penicillium argentinense]KAJ5110385.1 hypothetical protein N7532_000920 [Penicillium argentinense]
MKSPLYLLTVLLPLATEIVAASPTADFTDSDTLEERDRFNGGGGGKFGDKFNPCKIRKPYWYWKYPCDSSDKTSRESPGGQWNASCRYKNWYKTKKGWVHDFEKPKNCHGSWEHQQCPPPTFG